VKLILEPFTHRPAVFHSGTNGSNPVPSSGESDANSLRQGSAGMDGESGELILGRRRYASTFLPAAGA
jgi:hypothetical protein